MIFRAPLNLVSAFGGLQAVAGRLQATTVDGVPCTRIRILRGDAPLGDPCAPRAEMAGIRDAAGKPILWGPGDGHVVIATSLRLAAGWTVPSYPGSKGLFSVAPLQVHGSSPVAHPLVAIRCGVLDQGGPVSLGLAVCAGEQPNAGVNLPDRFVVPFGQWVSLLVEMDFGPNGGVALYAARAGKRLQNPPVARWAGALCQTQGGKPDPGAYLKLGHYMGANAYADVRPPAVDMWIGAVSVGRSWAEVLAA